MLDETMHKSRVSFFFGCGDSEGKVVVMVGLEKNLGPTFNNGEPSVFSTMVLIAGMTLACVRVLLTLTYHDK